MHPYKRNKMKYISGSIKFRTRRKISRAFARSARRLFYGADLRIVARSSAGRFPPRLSRRPAQAVPTHWIVQRPCRLFIRNFVFPLLIIRRVLRKTIYFAHTSDSKVAQSELFQLQKFNVKLNSTGPVRIAAKTIVIRVSITFFCCLPQVRLGELGVKDDFERFDTAEYVRYAQPTREEIISLRDCRLRRSGLNGLTSPKCYEFVIIPVTEVVRLFFKIVKAGRQRF